MSQMNDKANDFSKTLNLPMTDFPMRAGLSAREPEWVKRWLDMDVYGKLRAKRQAEGADKFIVHLGPPYANGNMHMGHALTYVLKDFMVREKFMAGYDSPYVPGWDCHGLPIEWKVEQDELRAKGKTKHDVSRNQLRAWCRAYAQKWVDIQKGDWQRFGALGDWDNPYLTMAAANEAGIVRELGKMVGRGLVYRGLKSTLWSWAEETAFAEAEVEYKDLTSTAIYVAFPLVGHDNEYVVIWTTTPWTMPANRAVAVREDEDYVLVNFNGKKIWLAAALREKCAGVLSAELSVEKTAKGADLIGLEYAHPLYAEMRGKIFHGDHVTTDDGTGLVHTAPAHGADDFQLGVEHGLDLSCPVDGAGKYLENVPDLPLTGEKIAGELIWPAQKKILAELTASGRLLHSFELKHSYPVSWRSKEKLIFRATDQWFVSMDKKIDALGGKSLREASLERIYGSHDVRGVNWVPDYGMNRIGSMIENRPDWCISRQRAWGVPITIISDWKGLIKDTSVVRDGLVIDPAVWEHIAGLVEKENIEAWDARLGGREAEFFPAGWLEKHGVTAADFHYATDILDVWFDSGTSHAHVLRADAKEPGQRFYRNDGKRPADVYQEGSDQHRGWFHSSLLTSVANYGDAPYENVVTSGFVVDGDGRKFSKSLGNGVEPRQLLDKYGMDIIRLWVASCDYSEDIRYSPQIMDAMADAYRKLRNTFRWLLGNLNGFDLATQGVSYDQMPELEQYMLHRLHAVSKEVRGYYDVYQFHRGYRALFGFCSTELSNLYFDVRKDVLYCDAQESVRRRACLTVLEHVFKMLATHLAPLICFTADEAWRSRYGDDACVHLETYPVMDAAWDKDEAFATRWDAILALRDGANEAIEQLRVAGQVTTNATAKVHVPAMAGVSHSVLAGLLSEVLAGAQVEVVDGLAAVEAMPAEGEKCPRCWQMYRKEASLWGASGVCLRCEEALALDKTKAA